MLVGEIDNVEDIYVYNITMKNSTDGARIKVWPGLNPENPKPDQGGGSGRVRNITYEQFHNWGNDRKCKPQTLPRDLSRNNTVCRCYRPYSVLLRCIPRTMQ